MLNVPENIKKLFRVDNTHKELKLYFYDKDIDFLYPEDTLFPSDNLFPVDYEPVYKIENEQISYESLKITESLCENSDLIFGQCNATQFEIVVADVKIDLTGMYFMATLEVGGYEMAMGKYKVESFVRQSDRRLRKITAYDKMRNFQVDVASWYQSLKFPMTLKTFRDSLCTHVGIVQVKTTLPLDDLQLTKTINPESLNGLDVIEAICEINGGFGKIDKTGRMTYVFLTQSSLFPSEELFPDDDLYPRDMSDKNTETLSHYNKSQTSYEEYVVYAINKLQIREEENSIGASYGEGDNPYTIQGNFLIYGKSSNELLQIMATISPNIFGKLYRPCKITSRCLPWVELGDGIVCYTSDDVIETYCFKRTISGIQAITDTYEAMGNVKQEESFGIQTQIIQLEGKTAVIKKSVEEVSVKLTDLKNYTEAQFKITADQILAEVKRAQDAEAALNIKADQISLSVKNLKEFTEAQLKITADQIALKVSKGEVSSQLSVESDKVTISGNRLIVNSTNFQLDGDGNARFSGTVSGAVIESSEFRSIDGMFWSDSENTSFGGFYAYKSDRTGVNYLATHFQEVGMGDYGPFCFWCGSSSDNPPFYVGMDGYVKCNDVFSRECSLAQGSTRLWGLGETIDWMWSELNDRIDNIGVE